MICHIFVVLESTHRLHTYLYPSFSWFINSRIFCCYNFDGLEILFVYSEAEEMTDLLVNYLKEKV